MAKVFFFNNNALKENSAATQKVYKKCNHPNGVKNLKKVNKIYKIREGKNRVQPNLRDLEKGRF
jgi:hypothetical protein